MDRQALAKQKYEGKIFPTQTGGDVLVLKYEGNAKVTIRFLNTGACRVISTKALVLGTVRDYTLPTVFGVGILGTRNVNKACHTIWSSILRRCYYEPHKKDFPTYIGCVASESFKHYPSFEAWCEKQKGFGCKGWHLDKDLLVKGNKVYSEDTCCFVPAEINTALVTCRSARGEFPLGVKWEGKTKKFRADMNKGKHGRIFLGYFNTPDEAFLAYKEAKEGYLKDLATLWKDDLDTKAYEALMQYKIEITD